MTTLDDRSACYTSNAIAREMRALADDSAAELGEMLDVTESLPLTDMERLCLTSRISYLEGQMAAALDAIRELRVKLEEREGDHK